MSHTVIGGYGFIGSEIVKQLRALGKEVYVPKRNDPNVFEKDLGIVIYAAGYGDCSKDPIKVLDSNVNLLTDIIQKSSFNRFIYISSTRVYMNQISSSESSNLTVCSDDQRALFNLTKLVAENIVLSLVEDSIVVRPSNVYGLAVNSPLFLPSIVRDAVSKNEINMYINKDYEKDYVSVNDVADAVCKLSETSGITDKVFNIASGKNTRADELAKILVEKTGCSVNWIENSVNETFSEIVIDKLKATINFSPSRIESDLESMIDSFMDIYNNNESFTI